MTMHVISRPFRNHMQWNSHSVLLQTVAFFCLHLPLHLTFKLCLHKASSNSCQEQHTSWPQLYCILQNISWRGGGGGGNLECLSGHSLPNPTGKLLMGRWIGKRNPAYIQSYNVITLLQRSVKFWLRGQSSSSRRQLCIFDTLLNIKCLVQVVKFVWNEVKNNYSSWNIYSAVLHTIGCVGLHTLT